VLSRKQRERLLVQLGGRVTRRSPLRIIVAGINWEIVAGFALVLGFLVFVLWQADPRAVVPATLAFLVAGWVFSLCLHEFTHAATAVLAGDDSESTLRYLSFNPLHYVNPLFSIALPLVFLLMGGIALPGGAVYLQRDRVRNRAWQSAISLAAPLMNLLLAVVLALPLRFGLLDQHPALAAALALLAFFQVMAGVLNLLPIPPLDGFGAIAYWLPEDVRNTAYTVGMYSVVVLFLVLWYVQPVGAALDTGVFTILARLGIDPAYVLAGFDTAFFWQH
jgi:Zn-dependent protease